MLKKLRESLGHPTKKNRQILLKSKITTKCDFLNYFSYMRTLKETNNNYFYTAEYDAKS